MAEPPAVITVTMNTAIDRVLKVPGFAVGGHLEADVVSHSPAGKGVNVARALARLGRPVTATGFVGQGEADQFGSLLCESEDTGLIDNQLIPVPGRTRENTTVVDSVARTDTHLRTQGYTLTSEAISTLSDKISRLSRDGTVFVFAGSLPAGMDEHGLIRLITTAQSRGARVVLDLNGKTLGGVLSALSQQVWMISPNRTELAEAVGHVGEVDDQAVLAAASQVSKRAGCVLASLGSGGALLMTESGTYRGRCNVDANQVSNTVSAGDCLLAGVIDAQARGLSPQDILRHGLAVATASTFHLSPAEFKPEDVEALSLTAQTHAL